MLHVSFALNHRGDGICAFMFVQDNDGGVLFLCNDLAKYETEQTIFIFPMHIRTYV